MKKIFILVILVLVCGGIFFFINNKKDANVKKKDNSVEEFSEEVTGDIFNQYYNDASKLMKNMTLEEKVGQLFLVRYDVSTSSKQITDYYAGGFVLFAKDFESHTKESIKSELAKKQIISKIPLVMAVDEEGGYVTRVSRFPTFRFERFKSNRVLFETGGL